MHNPPDTTTINTIRLRIRTKKPSNKVVYRINPWKAKTSKQYPKLKNTHLCFSSFLSIVLNTLIEKMIVGIRYPMSTTA